MMPSTRAVLALLLALGPACASANHRSAEAVPAPAAVVVEPVTPPATDPLAQLSVERLMERGWSMRIAGKPVESRAAFERVLTSLGPSPRRTDIGPPAVVDGPRFIFSTKRGVLVTSPAVEARAWWSISTGSEQLTLRGDSLLGSRKSKG